MLNKDQLIFDPADIANTDTVGSYLLDGAGNAVTSTDVSGKQSLDVNVTQLTVTDLDIRDLDASQDNVAVSDGTNTLVVNADGSINVDLVDDLDIDIRDLNANQDNIAISDGTDTLEINVDGSLNAVVSATDLDIRDLSFATDSVDVSGSSITVSATDLDIRDLTSATDSVTAVIAGNETCSNSAVSVTSTATSLGTPLVNRKKILIQNLGNQDIFLGCDNSVTTANGVRIPKGGSGDFDFGASVTLHAITNSGTADVRIIEAGE